LNKFKEILWNNYVTKFAAACTRTVSLVKPVRPSVRMEQQLGYLAEVFLVYEMFKKKKVIDKAKEKIYIPYFLVECLLEGVEKCRKTRESRKYNKILVT